MTARIAAALFALALPLLAQEKAAPEADALFYKAYWLQKGERKFAEAMTLYEQFLQAAPEHRLAKDAATLNYDLLTNTGKTKDAEAFAKKYEALLGKVTPGAPAAAGEGRGAGARGDARGEGRPRADLADLKKQLEEAKAAGDTERVAQLERQIQRMERAAQDGQPQGQGQGRRGRGMQAVEFAKLSAEELTTWKKDNLERMTTSVARLRENGMEEQAKQLEDSVAAIKTALDAGKLDEAQKLYDKMRESMRGRRGGGGGGDAGGAPRDGGGGAPAPRPAGGGGGGGTGRDGGI